MSTMSVFYAGMWLIDIPKGEFISWRRSMCHGDPEVYNGAFVHNKQDPGWYRLDGTPVLLSDVPPDLQLLNLLLT